MEALRVAGRKRKVPVKIDWMVDRTQLTDAISILQYKQEIDTLIASETDRRVPSKYWARFTTVPVPIVDVDQTNVNYTALIEYAVESQSEEDDDDSAVLLPFLNTLLIPPYVQNTALTAVLNSAERQRYERTISPHNRAAELIVQGIQDSPEDALIIWSEAIKEMPITVYEMIQDRELAFRKLQKANNTTIAMEVLMQRQEKAMEVGEPWSEKDLSAALVRIRASLASETPLLCFLAYLPRGQWRDNVSYDEIESTRAMDKRLEHLAIVNLDLPATGKAKNNEAYKRSFCRNKYRRLDVATNSKIPLFHVFMMSCATSENMTDNGAADGLLRKNF
jgi:hypothetical protein